MLDITNISWVSITYSALAESLQCHIPKLSRYSAITPTALLVFPCCIPSAVWPITIADPLACKVSAPEPFFFASTTSPSPRKNRYFTPSARTPFAMNGVKSLSLKHFAMDCASFAVNLKAFGCWSVVHFEPLFPIMQALSVLPAEWPIRLSM